VTVICQGYIILLAANVYSLSFFFFQFGQCQAKVITCGNGTPPQNASAPAGIIYLVTLAHRYSSTFTDRSEASRKGKWGIVEHRVLVAPDLEGAANNWLSSFVPVVLGKKKVLC
jgi:hypothetical protein